MTGTLRSSWFFIFLTYYQVALTYCLETITRPHIYETEFAEVFAVVGGGGGLGFLSVLTRYSFPKVIVWNRQKDTNLLEKNRDASSSTFQVIN